MRIESWRGTGSTLRSMCPAPEHTQPISFTHPIAAEQFQWMLMEKTQLDLLRSRRQMILETRCPGVNGTTGI